MNLNKIILIIVFVLLGCDTGHDISGGPQSSLNGVPNEFVGFQTREELLAKYNEKIDLEYAGKVKEIEITEDNFQPIFNYVNKFLLGDILNYPVNIASIANGLRNPPYKALSRYQKENMHCDNGGQIIYQGLLDERDAGGLDLVYYNCEIDGVTLNGQGAIYFSNVNYDSMVLFYDQVSFESESIDIIKTGYEVIDSFGVVSSLVIDDNLNNSQHRIENFRNRVEVSGSSPAVYAHTMNGGLYIPHLGKINRVSAGVRFDNEERNIEGSRANFDFSQINGGQCEVDVNDEIAVFTLMNTYEHKKKAAASYWELIANNNYFLLFSDSSSFVPPPHKGKLTRVKSSYKSTDEIEVGFQYGNNNDDDVTYVWMADNIEIARTTEPKLPASEDLYSSEITVFAIIENEAFQIQTDPLTIDFIDDDRFIQEESIEAFVGEVIDFNIQINNATIAASDLTFVDGPEGISFKEGRIQWVGPEVYFSKQKYLVKIKVNDRDKIYTFPIVIKHPNRNRMFAHSSLSKPKRDDAISIGNFDEDANLEAIIVGGDSLLYTLELSDTGLTQDWLNPQKLKSPKELVKAIGGRDNEFGYQGVIVSTLDQVFNKYSTFDDFHSIYTSPNNIEDILLVEDSYLAVLSKKLVELIDLETFEVIWSRQLDSYNNTLKYGDVYGGLQNELVISSGLVLDALTGELVWKNSNKFSGTYSYSALNANFIALIDIDSDGLNEIVGVSDSKVISAYSAVSKSKLWEVNYSEYIKSLGTHKHFEDINDNLVIISEKSADYFELDELGITKVHSVKNDDVGINVALAFRRSKFYSSELLLFATNRQYRKPEVILLESPKLDSNYHFAGEMIDSKDYNVVGVSFDDKGGKNLFFTALSDEGNKLLQYRGTELVNSKNLSTPSWGNILNPNITRLSNINYLVYIVDTVIKIEDVDTNTLWWQTYPGSNSVKQYKFLDSNKTIMSVQYNDAVVIFDISKQLVLASYFHDQEIISFDVLTSFEDGVASIVFNDYYSIHKLELNRNNIELSETLDIKCQNLFVYSNSNSEKEVLCSDFNYSYESSKATRLNRKLEFVNEFYTPFRTIEKISLDRHNFFTTRNERCNGVNESTCGHFVEFFSPELNKVIWQSPNLLSQINGNVLFPYVDQQGNKQIQLSFVDSVLMSQ